jgi:hypothetical protein
MMLRRPRLIDLVNRRFAFRAGGERETEHATERRSDDTGSGWFTFYHFWVDWPQTIQAVYCTRCVSPRRFGWYSDPASSFLSHKNMATPPPAAARHHLHQQLARSRRRVARRPVYFLYLLRSGGTREAVTVFPRMADSPTRRHHARTRQHHREHVAPGAYVRVVQSRTTRCAPARRAPALHRTPGSTCWCRAARCTQAAS